MESQRVVVGVSQSLAGLAALRHAVALAGERDAVLHAVRAWSFTPTWRDGNAEYWSRVHAIEAEMMIPMAFEAAMGEVPRGVRASTIEDAAGPTLVEYAAGDGDLLVVGGDRRSSHPILGSGPVTRYCVRHARCPLVVVPPPSLAQAQPVDALVRELGRDLAR